MNNYQWIDKKGLEKVKEGGIEKGRCNQRKRKGKLSGERKRKMIFQISFIYFWIFYLFLTFISFPFFYFVLYIRLPPHLLPISGDHPSFEEVADPAITISIFFFFGCVWVCDCVCNRACCVHLCFQLHIFMYVWSISCWVNMHVPLAVNSRHQRQ